MAAPRAGRGGTRNTTTTAQLPDNSTKLSTDTTLHTGHWTTQDSIYVNWTMFALIKAEGALTDNLSVLKVMAGARAEQTDKADIYAEVSQLVRDDVVVWT